MTLIKLVNCFDEHLDSLASNSLTHFKGIMQKYPSMQMVSSGLYKSKEITLLLCRSNYDFM